MVYTIIVNGISYDLPKKTLDVMTEIESVLKTDGNPNIPLRDKYQRVYTFISRIVGKDEAKEIFGTDELNEMDLSDLTITFQKIVAAYDKPVEDYKNSQGLDALNQIPIEKIIALGKVADKMQK